MRHLFLKSERKEASLFIDKAANYALKATCKRSQCGCVIVKGKKIIGIGSNNPPKRLESQRRCDCKKDSYHKKVTDKTCCIHAEQKAIMFALEHYPELLAGSRLYFIRLDNMSGAPSTSGDPYCTICSKMALDVGIKEFVLLTKRGLCVYDTEEYNTLSYQYTK